MALLCRGLSGMIICLGLLVALSCYPVWADSPAKLGISAPLTGPASAWGEDLKNVLLFANEKLADGKYSFVIEDDRCIPKEAVTIAHKLTRVDQVAGAFIVCGATVLASAPVYEKARVVLMAPLATPR